MTFYIDEWQCIGGVCDNLSWAFYNVKQLIIMFIAK